MNYFRSVTHAVRVHAGHEALAALPGELQRLGIQRALVLSGRSVSQKTGLVAAITGRAPERIAGVYDGLGKEAPLADVRRAVQAARACGADGLIAVGAGSVLKAARGVAILLAERGPLETLITRYTEDGPAISARLAAPKLPIFNILTAPTSAQGRAGSALYDHDGLGRIEFYDPKTRPAAIFWDPDALATAPASLARNTGVAVYWRALMNMGGSQDANPLVQGDREQAWRLARRALPAAWADDPVRAGQARIDLCAAALLQNRDEDDGGHPNTLHWIARTVYALGAGVIHACAGVSQGQAHAALTPAAVVQFGPLCLPAIRAMAVAIGRPDLADERTEPGTAARAIAAAIGETFTALGMPVRLSDVGVTPHDLPRVLALARTNFNADRHRDFLAHAERLSRTLANAL